MYYTYILRSVNQAGAIYIGSTNNLKRRLPQHNNPESKQYSRRFAPWEIETYIAFSTENQAKTMEKHLKSSSGKAFMKKRLLSEEFIDVLEKFKNNRQDKQT